MSIDSCDKPREGLGAYLSHTLLGKGRLIDPRSPRPFVSPLEELAALNTDITAAIASKDFERFTQKFEELRTLAKRGSGNLPAFKLLYSLLYEFHGRERFASFLNEYIPDLDAPKDIFNKRPDIMSLISGMSIKDFQFLGHVNKGFVKQRVAELETQENFSTPDDDPTSTRLAGL